MLLVDYNDPYRDQDGLEPKEPHPHPVVLRLVTLVYEELLGAPDLLPQRS